MADVFHASVGTSSPLTPDACLDKRSNLRRRRLCRIPSCDPRAPVNLIAPTGERSDAHVIPRNGQGEEIVEGDD
ncbi:MAG: hypothetical protein U0835_10280 [Isosphaeraceae bacterium]